MSLREEIAKAGATHDGHVTNGSLDETMKVIEQAVGMVTLKLAEENKELLLTIELIREADMRGIKMWQEAHPKWNLVWPDRGKMIFWLLEQLEAKK